MIQNRCIFTRKKKKRYLEGFPRCLETVLWHLKDFLRILCDICGDAGAHHSQRATTPYSCHGVFTDRSIFSLNLPKFKKISRRGSRSPDNAEFGHFTLLLSRERQRNQQRFLTFVRSHCFAL